MHHNTSIESFEPIFSLKHTHFSYSWPFKLGCVSSILWCNICSIWILAYIMCCTIFKTCKPTFKWMINSSCFTSHSPTPSSISSSSWWCWCSWSLLRWGAVVVGAPFDILALAPKPCLGDLDSLGLLLEWGVAVLSALLDTLTFALALARCLGDLGSVVLGPPLLLFAIGSLLVLVGFFGLPLSFLDLNGFAIVELVVALYSLAVEPTPSVLSKWHLLLLRPLTWQRLHVIVT